MAEIIEMLALSPTMDEGTLVEWLKAEGDTIEEGEIIAEIETDKATMEMESFFDGTILKLLAEPGDAVEVGSPLAIIGEAGESIDDLLAEIESGGGSGANDSEDADDGSEADDADDAADADGASHEETPDEKNSGDGAGTQPTHRADGDRIFASPVAKRIAEEKGYDLAQIPGSGPNGRIVKADVEAYAPSKTSRPRAAATIEGPAEGSKEDLSQMRKTIAKRLVPAWSDVPHFFLTMDIDMAACMRIRKEINAQLAETEAGVKLSVNDFIVKACGVALERYPQMNRSFQGDHYVQYERGDVGVAVAIEEGLITPVVRGVSAKTLTAISTEVRELAGRAREKKLKPEEYTGGTFSISNLGMFGIEHFTAIINPPEAGILACGAVKKVPVVVDNALEVGTRMKVTLSCDHRIVDGATGSEFLNVVKQHLENPYLLLV